MNPYAMAAVIAFSAALAACGKQADVPAKTGAATPMSSSTTSAAPAAADRETPPAPTPATHAQAPQPEATGAATARDTPASGPTKDLTPAEESKSMPKPGQTDNHFTPSIDGATKGSQQSSGTPAPTAPTTSPAPSK